MMSKIIQKKFFQFSKHLLHTKLTAVPAEPVNRERILVRWYIRSCFVGKYMSSNSLLRNVVVFVAVFR